MKDVTGLPSATSFEVSKLVNLSSGVVKEKRDVKDIIGLPSAVRFEVSKLVQAAVGRGGRGNGM